MKKKTKKLLKTAGIFSASAAATYLLIGNIFYYVTLTKSGIKNPVVAKIASGRKEHDEELEKLDAIKNDGKIWFDNAEKEKVIIKSSSGKNIHADFLFAENESDVFVIVIHGYTSEPRGMGMYAEKYHELGYNVLMPSLNGHADSESEVVTMGWNDRLIIVDWANFLAENFPDCKIILHGESMGAATTMMTTGEELPENVKVAVADCGYTSVWDIFSNKVKNNFKMHEFPALYSANTVNKLYSGFNFKEASAVEQLKKSKTPTIFIHGDKDTFVPYEMLDKVYEAAACEKEKITIPDSPHARNACTNPELYWNSVIDFINKYI